MLESIISPGTAERKPWDMIILGFIISSVALWLGFYLAEYIPASPSILVLVITVMALAPLMHRVFVIEEIEEEEAKHNSVWGFITRHTDIISLYSFLFIGLLISFSFWYVFLPYEAGNIPSGDEIFSLQASTISSLQKQISGGATGMAVEENSRSANFVRLFNNNLRVMIFCFLASFLFGAGALWIMAWNASTIGVFIGNKIKTVIVTGTSPVEAYAAGFPQYSLGIALWAIPEVLAYLIAAIAGGIVSIAIVRHHFKSEKFWLAVFDGVFFMIIASFLVILGAYIEHFFLPV